MKDKRAWTTKEVEVLRNGFANGVNVNVIAKKLNRTATAVYKQASRMGIKRLSFCILFDE